MHADVRLEDIQLNATELDILERAECGKLPLETPLTDEHRAALRRFVEWGVMHDPCKPARKCGKRAVKVNKDDGRCTTDELVERFLKHSAQKRAKTVKEARKREQRKRYCDALMANLPAFIRKPVFKLGHLVMTMRRYLN